MGTAERFNPHARKTTQTVPVEARDRYGRSLVQGDMVFVKPFGDMAWRVAGIGPDVDPRSTRNIVLLELTATYRLHVPAGEVVRELVRVGTAAEHGAPAPELQHFPPRVSWWKRLVGRGTGGGIGSSARSADAGETGANSR